MNYIITSAIMGLLSAGLILKYSLGADVKEKNMKLIISTIASLFLLTSVAKSQDAINLSERDCGTWRLKQVVYTEWVAVDTLGNRKIGQRRSWIYSTVKSAEYTISSLMYCPCGCDPKYFQIQYRICEITGIRQKRNIIHEYTYDQPNDPYTKAVDSLSSSSKQLSPR